MADAIVPLDSLETEEKAIVLFKADGLKWLMHRSAKFSKSFRVKFSFFPISIISSRSHAKESTTNNLAESFILRLTIKYPIEVITKQVAGIKIKRLMGVLGGSFKFW